MHRDFLVQTASTYLDRLGRIFAVAADDRVGQSFGQRDAEPESQAIAGPVPCEAMAGDQFDGFLDPDDVAWQTEMNLDGEP